MLRPKHNYVLKMSEWPCYRILTKHEDNLQIYKMSHNNLTNECKMSSAELIKISANGKHYKIQSLTTSKMKEC